MVWTKGAADFLWNVWSWFGALILFYFLMEAQVHALNARSDLAFADDLKSILERLEPLPPALLFVPVPVYAAACPQALLTLADLLYRKRVPPNNVVC